MRVVMNACGLAQCEGDGQTSTSHQTYRLHIKVLHAAKVGDVAVGLVLILILVAPLVNVGLEPVLLQGRTHTRRSPSGSNAHEEVTTG